MSQDEKFSDRFVAGLAGFMIGAMIGVSYVAYLAGIGQGHIKGYEKAMSEAVAAGVARSYTHDGEIIKYAFVVTHRYRPHCGCDLKKPCECGNECECCFKLPPRKAEPEPPVAKGEGK